MEEARKKTIWTVFAGRRDCITVLTQYLNLALAGGLIDEVHLWNYARETENDEPFLRENSNLRRTYGTYMPVHTEIRDGASFSFSFRCAHDMCILVDLAGGIIARSYEIVLGGWRNTRSIIRPVGDGEDKKEKALGSSGRAGVAIATTLTHVTVSIAAAGPCPQLQVFLGVELLMACDLDPGCTSLQRVAMKTGCKSRPISGDVYYPAVRHPGVFFMDAANKTH